jgi:hypothetical protein
MLGAIAETVYSAMNPTCASNVVSLMCHTFFRECAPVNDKLNGGIRWLPSLLCRSECDKHWETWNKCVADLNADPEGKNYFKTQVQSLVRHKTVFVCFFSYVVVSSYLVSMGQFAPLQVEILSIGHTFLTQTGIRYKCHNPVLY